MKTNWQGKYKEHSHTSNKNIINGLLCFVALVPSYILIYLAFNTNFCNDKIKE
jgi:hypothetical protein